MLSIASRANAKNLHVLWPIIAPTLRLRQSERHIPAAPIRTSELSSNLSGQRRILRHFGASRLHTHASLNITPKVVFFQYNFLSPLLCLWSTCHSLFGINDESLYWRFRQDSLGKSSKMPNDAYGRPRGLLHSLCQKGIKQLSFKSTRLVPSGIWRKREEIPHALYPYGKRGHPA